MKSTPEIRYSDYLTYLTSDKGKQRAYYRYASTDMGSLLKKYTTLIERLNEYRSVYIRSRRRDYGRLEYFSTEENLADIDDFVHTSKCRCSEAKVVDIIGMFDGKHYDNAVSTYDYGFIYELNATVKPDDWERDLYKICGSGIHYFEYPILALLYRLRTHDLDFMKQLDDDFKNTYLTEELNKKG